MRGSLACGLGLLDEDSRARPPSSSTARPASRSNARRLARCRPRMRWGLCWNSAMGCRLRPQGEPRGPGNRGGPLKGAGGSSREPAAPATRRRRRQQEERPASRSPAQPAGACGHEQILSACAGSKLGPAELSCAKAADHSLQQAGWSNADAAYDNRCCDESTVVRWPAGLLGDLPLPRPKCALPPPR